MTKLSTMLATSFSLSITASEEASRFGVPEVDIEHVLLALVIDEGSAGRTLRGLGITLDAARSAVTGLHHDQLAALGIDAEMPEAGRIRFLEQGGSDWTDRAMKLLTESGSRGKPGDAVAVLREALTEPSGTVEGILAALGVTPTDVTLRLDQAQLVRNRDAARRGALSRTHSVFVPAPATDVWGLVSDPDSLPEWEMNLASVTPSADGWEGRTRTIAPDGKALKVRAETARQLIALRAADRPHHVTWEMQFPDAPRANRRSITVDIEPAAGGAQVTVTFAWLRGPGPSGLLRLIAPVTRFIARPAVTFALWIQTTALTSAISRALRA
ncbi:MAG: Clp protease N-terminal domain-containing protein [Microbacterium gubbeenense]